jgi:hypothetical protein
MVKNLSRSLSKTSKFFIGVAAGSAVLVFALVILEATHVIDLIQINETKTVTPTAEQLKQQEETNGNTKDQFINATPTPSSSATTTSDKVMLSAHQEANGNVTVITKIYDSSASQCQLSVTNGSNMLQKQSQVIYQPEYSTCAGFSIQKSELSSGTWQISLTVSGNGATINATTSVEVK